MFRQLFNQINGTNRVHLNNSLFYNAKVSAPVTVSSISAKPIHTCLCTNIKKVHSLKIFLSSALTSNAESVMIFRRILHTSSPNKTLPPGIWALLRQLLRFGAIVAGRGLREWWLRLPNNKRQFFLQEIQKRRRKIMSGTIFSGLIAFTYYRMHLVEDPIAKRKKFLIFSEKQIMEMANLESEKTAKMFEGKIITSGYRYDNVLQISKRILEANRSVPGTKRNWRVVIADEKTRNAFVLPNRDIFVFSGILSTVANDDQLAAVIGHEIAHVLLSHAAETASKTHFLELLMILPLVALWALLPDSIVKSSHYFTDYLATVLFKLPFSRNLEAEADVIGLEMIARACFDPRQASTFWKMMEKMANGNDQVEWLSTHPSHKTRYKTIDGLLPKVLHIFNTHC